MNQINNNPVQVHIGQKAQEVFEQKGLKLSDFADQLGTVRQNVYRIFKKHDLDTGLLTKLSQVLGHNFFQYYCEGSDQDSLQDLRIQKLEEELALSKKEIDYLKKIIMLMEEKAELVQHIEKPVSQLSKEIKELKREDTALVA
jgi:transcriptional regulator with XRE-family HTH domain